MSVEGPVPISSAQPAQNPAIDPDKLKQENALELERLKSELDPLEEEIRKIESEQKALNEKKKTGTAPDEYDAEQTALDERRTKAEDRRDEVEKLAQELIRKMNLVGFFTAKEGDKEEAQKKEDGNKDADQKKQEANAKAKSKETTPAPKKAKGDEEKDEKKKGRMAQWWDKVGHIYTTGDNDEAGNEMALIMMRLLALLALLFKLGKMAGNKAKEAVEEKLANKNGELESERQDLFKQNEDLDQQKALQDTKLDLFHQVQDDTLGDDELEELFAMSKGAPPTYKEATEPDEGIEEDLEEEDPLIYEEEEVSSPVYQQATVSDVEHAVPQHAAITTEQEPDFPDDDSAFEDDDQVLDDEEMEIDGEKIEGEIMGHAVPPLTQGKVEPLQAQSTSLPEASSALSAEEELASLEKNLFSAELPEEDNSQREKLLAATKDVADKTADLLKGVDNGSATTESTAEPAFPEEEKVITQLRQSPDWPQEGRVKELIAKHEGFIAEAGKDLNSEEVRAKEAAKASEMGLEAREPAGVEQSADFPQEGGVKALIAKHEGFIAEAGKDLNSEEVRAKEAAKASEMGLEAREPTGVEQSPDSPQEGRVKELIAKHEGFIAEAGKDLNSEEVRAKEAAKSQENQPDVPEPVKAELGAEAPKPALSPEEELASLEKNLFSAQLPEEDNGQKENLLAATKQVADATTDLLKQVNARPEASAEKNVEQKVEAPSQAEEAAPTAKPKGKGRVAELIQKHEDFSKEDKKELNSQQVQEKDAKKVLSQSLEEKGVAEPEKVAEKVMDFSKQVAANFVASNNGVSPPEQNFQMMMQAILTAETVKKDSNEHKANASGNKENQNPNSSNAMSGMGGGMEGMDAEALGGEDMASEATMGMGPKDIDKLQNGSKAEKAEVAGKMAATAMGIPPPANAMVGEACGKAVEKMEGMNPKNQIEGVTATMGEIAQGIAAETADGGTAAPASSEEQAGSEFGKLLGNLTASTIKVTTDVVTKGFSGALSAPGNDGPDPAAEKKGSFTPGANAHQSSATSKKDYVPQPEAAPAPPPQEPSSKPSAKPASH